MCAWDDIRGETTSATTILPGTIQLFVIPTIFAKITFDTISGKEAPRNHLDHLHSRGFGFLSPPQPPFPRICIYIAFSIDVKPAKPISIATVRISIMAIDSIPNRDRSAMAFLPLFSSKQNTMQIKRDCRSDPKTLLSIRFHYYPPFSPNVIFFGCTKKSSLSPSFSPLNS